MTRIEEIKREIADKLEAIKVLKGDEKEVMYKEILNLNKELEDLEIDNVLSNIQIEKKQAQNGKLDDKKGVSLIHAWAKAVMNKPMTEDEQTLLKNVIAGEENIQIKELSTRVRELLRENRSILKQYVTVVKTKAISGQYPVLTLEDSLLKEVTDGVEMTEENDGIGFKLVKFSMSKKGRLFVLNDTVLKFSAADLIAYVARLFVQCYVRTVNKAILDKMLFDEDGITRAEHKVITGVQGVVSATRTDLDSELEGGAKLFVHKTTYDKLANDINAKDGIAWLQPDLSQPAKMYINGVEVVKVAKELESYEKKGDPNTKVYPVLYANLEQAILMFEDDEYTTDMQKNFRRNCVDQKIITYFDVAVADEEAFKLLGIEESTI